MFGIDEFGGLGAHRAQQSGELIRGVEIGLVQHDKHRPPRYEHGFQRRQFGIGNVAVEHEHDEIGATGDFIRQRLAVLATRLVESRRVDQENAASLRLVPGLHARAACLAVNRADGKAFFADQRVQQ